MLLKLLYPISVLLYKAIFFLHTFIYSFVFLKAYFSTILFAKGIREKDIPGASPWCPFLHKINGGIAKKNQWDSKGVSSVNTITEMGA